MKLNIKKEARRFTHFAFRLNLNKANVARDRKRNFLCDKTVTAGIIMLAITVFMLSYAAFATYDVKILVNGERVQTSTAPYIENGSTLIPLRDVFETLGAEVVWDDEDRFAAAAKDGILVQIYPDSGRFIKNGQEIELSAPPKITNDRIMVPLRALSEAFGYNVLWSGDDYTVSITDTKVLKVHFLDCGQADCAFVELPDGKCMLIDAAESSFGKTLEAYIRDKGYTHIDYVIATHPHSDHIGGMAHILESFSVGTFYMPNVPHTTKTYEKMLDALVGNECECVYISTGYDIEIEPYSIKVLSPLLEEYIRMNNYSAVTKLSYKDTQVLFSADAEATAEEEMINGGFDLTADILKAGHHGSLTSTTHRYLSAVSPKDVVISVGRDNSYGFPASAVLSQIEAIGARVHRTDLEGNITAVSDGYIYVIENE